MGIMHRALCLDWAWSERKLRMSIRPYYKWIERDSCLLLKILMSEMDMKS